MAFMCRSGILCVPLLIAAMASAYAQQQEGVTSPPNPPAQPRQAPAPSTLEDGGYSLEPFYWFTTLLPVTPLMRGGASSSASNADLAFPGIIKNAPGVILSIPALQQSTFRISVFRVLGRGDETLPTDLTLLGTSYSQGQWLATTHVVDDVKVSWDFLTFRVPTGPGKLRVKTLWEAQWVRFGANVDAPYAPVLTDSSGNVVPNAAFETRSIILPTFGAELEQSPARHFRYELKASGFGIPHHADIWEAEGALAFRFGRLELLAGVKAFHFKTSPQGDEYYTETLSGPYAGIRYYLHNPE